MPRTNGTLVPGSDQIAHSGVMINIVGAGYTSATFTGDAVDDRLLQLVSTNTDLTFLSVNSCHSITDAGISAAVMASQNLTTLIVRDTSTTETYGHFLGKVLALQHLQKLELRSQMIDLQEVAPDNNSRPYDLANLQAC